MQRQLSRSLITCRHGTTALSFKPWLATVQLCVTTRGSQPRLDLGSKGLKCKPHFDTTPRTMPFQLGVLLAWLALVCRTIGSPTPALASRAILVEDASKLRSVYDYVIVGGGTSGLVVANRLTEDPKSTRSLFRILLWQTATNARTRSQGTRARVRLCV
jgi:hypothetical protein